MTIKFQSVNSIFDKYDLSDEQFSEIQTTYAILEPLFSDYLTPHQKRMMRLEVCQKLDIAERTLYQMLKELREEGPICLVRRVRKDKGKYRKFNPVLLDSAKKLLIQNPARSMEMVMKLLKADPEISPLINGISTGTLYSNLRKSGFDLSSLRKSYIDKPFRSFEKDWCNALWQGDARHGIYLPHPEKPDKVKRTYLFAWVDDFSRKILFARYYWDEKLPRLEDCLRQAILRWGLPEKIYVDNGSVYISKQFTCIAASLGIRKIHHPPYRAWCKGKVEAVMKRFKAFQKEAELAGFKTIDELNETLAAWIEIEYNNKLHSSTGETPNSRFYNSTIKYPPKRIKDIDAFNVNFLWREYRIVDKRGFISLFGNSYRLYDIGIGEKVEVRFNPFKLTNIHVYKHKKYVSTVKAYTITNNKLRNLPEENKKSDKQVSKEAVNYFSNLRKKHLEDKSENAFNFSNIVTEVTDDK
jgi:putative transposase